jgi:hypothetical protein
VLDVAFDKAAEHNHFDHRPEYLTILRQRAPNLLRSARADISTRRKRKRSGCSDEVARTKPRALRKAANRALGHFTITPAPPSMVTIH